MAPSSFSSRAATLLLISSTTSFAQVLIPTTEPLTDWSYTGCYTDDVGKRTLTGGGYTSGDAMANSACVQYCASKGFFYAGTEYAAEC
ncbi:hypothetical protein BDV96DRAFT_222507 [Lophiotrema nucula]|uniref:WSC domain-containing protein n=1 Tax=Lophiotrema nucula TaxID=690887 RepID=A0A6A5YTS6_9PLEO|nr:hypothetical protein BDV96DRAFT_222507 [Lophiotrema nucula]